MAAPVTSASGTRRRLGLITMLIALSLLVATVTTRGADKSVVENESVAEPEASTETPPTPRPRATSAPSPLAQTTRDPAVKITRLWSPTANTARAEGTIDGDEMTVTVKVAGIDTASVHLVADQDGSFTVDIGDLEPGPQDVCLANACQRLLVQEPDVEDRHEIEDRIEQAVASALQRFPYDELLPGWSIEVAGPNASSAGSTQLRRPLHRHIPNRTRYDGPPARTVLRELGHAFDAQHMTPASRQDFGVIRGHDASLLWGPVAATAVGDERWRNSAEDFAEVFVAWVLDGDYSIRTTAVAPQPTRDELRAFCELLAIDALDCS